MSALEQGAAGEVGSISSSTYGGEFAMELVDEQSA